MRVRILGTAAGGGVPQWNCGCAGCAGARRHPGWRRTHASIAVSGSSAGPWYVVNATPDLTDQIEACPDLQPEPGGRRTPLAGVILTDAELDHTLGLFRLREASAVRVLSTDAVWRGLSNGLRLAEVLAPYTDLSWQDLRADESVPLDGGLRVRAVPVSAKRPRYAADEPAGEWSVALRIDGERGSLVYAPCMADWSAELDKELADADCAILDGTFWDDQEPSAAGLSRPTATRMGHLPISGPAGTAERFARLPARHRLYTHLNNTNPLIDPDAPQHALLAAQGIAVAAEGMTLDL
ncbi:pyrroloquinoline quinone biosynthesis protein PqqB [Actinomadura rupiterrae]|uniref:pyrroloquinoline quinone biosynthesis protein PqqB n=1 Tax=Actinomadura rupiterrae TaxID=559627 RepID=UPI0020A57C7E|nr:pyrroloquinoline quinone biosynthesis protein PqqB [Actinomadura rupiterrae]MCP2342568.1 pyrroloquinoline quinone biosynthesis protein B [Actinomadura rupiterrae]